MYNFLGWAWMRGSILALLRGLFIYDRARLQMQQTEQVTPTRSTGCPPLWVSYKLTQIPLPGTAAAVTWCLTLDDPSERRGVDDEGGVSGQRWCKALCDDVKRCLSSLAEWSRPYRHTEELLQAGPVTMRMLVSNQLKVKFHPVEMEPDTEVPQVCYYISAIWKKRGWTL